MSCLLNSVIHSGIIQNLCSMQKFFFFLCMSLMTLCYTSCKPEVKIEAYLHETSPLVDEYEGMVIPYNIAPLNFFVSVDDGAQGMVLTYGDTRLSAISEDGAIIPDLDDWKSLLDKAKGNDLKLEHCIHTDDGWKAYDSFTLHVSEDGIDPYLVYRLIPPGYEMWNEMGLYQRNLENFDESVVVENKNAGYNCVNCHSFCMHDPEMMMFHSRAVNAGTIIIRNDNMQKLDTKTDKTISSMVYPHWHPSGKYIASSVNTIKQMFHVNRPNRAEVMDLASDVVVYDIDKNQIVTTPLLFDETKFETFPAFSPDGKTLYYCVAEAKQPIPDDFDQLKYYLCSISFDEKTCSFGNSIDTLFHAGMADKSVSFPRVSPDGKKLLFTLSDYGNFSIWHQEADLWMIDLATRELTCMDKWNSQSVESYHSWSSNSRWVVFSSRRMDGLYTRPYIAYIGADGRISKPFVVPQKNGSFYTNFINSYNIPEFVKGKIEVGQRELLDVLCNDAPKKVSATTIGASR